MIYLFGFYFIFYLFSGIPSHNELAFHNSLQLKSDSAWKLSRTKTFYANDLYGHIDGGAELFLELGFKELNVLYFKKDKDEIAVETYKMESPESALGIYLFKCGKENRIKEVQPRNTGDYYQIMAIKNNCYIATNNLKGNKKLLPDMISLLNKELDKISEIKNKDYFSLLPKKGLLPKSELLIRGPFSLQSVYTFGEGDVLILNGKIFGYYGEYKNKYSQIIIEYPSTAYASEAFNNLINNFDNTKKIIISGKKEFIFIDHNKKYSSGKLSKKIISILFNLDEQPRK